MSDLKSFQRKFLQNAFADWCRFACLSIPRGNAKSWLGAYAAVQAMTPGNKWYVGDRREVIVVAASLEQSRAVFGQFRDMLETSGLADEYRWTDSQRSLGCLDKRTNTRLRIMSSSGRSAMGLVNVGLLIADEPSSWKVNDGELLYRAITTAQAKPNSLLRVLMIGTLAPSEPNSWYPRLVKSGTNKTEGRYVQLLQADPDKWLDWSEIRRVNPLVVSVPETRKILRQDWRKAQKDVADKAAFLSYHCNTPTGDSITQLLSSSDWQEVIERLPGKREGEFICGLDLGQGRAWSCAFAYWYETGLCDAIGIAPGVPGLDAQERRDRVPDGIYKRLVESGALTIATGRKVPTATDLLERVVEHWGQPVLMIADHFRLAEVEDALPEVGLNCELEARRTRWSESSEDIREFRKACLDGNLSVYENAKLLLTASMMVAKIATDDAGNLRLKKSANNTGRDDAIAAGLLAVGAAKHFEGQQEFLYIAI